LTPSRTQVLPGPGVGLLLAAALGRIAGALPRRLGPAFLIAAATWVVAVGTGRVVAMQKEWDGHTLWPAQNDTLARLTRMAPDVRPGTLFVLIDEDRAWPASFTFRHAVRLLYGDHATGTVWGALPFLYPTSFEGAGLRSDPWPIIRRTWGVEPRVHGYGELVVLRRPATGGLRVEERWPPELPPLPPGAAYDPWTCVVHGGTPPAQRRILVQDPSGD
jgi:hypothetical protein